MDAKLKKFIKKYNDVFETIDNGKLRCTVTKHELPSRLEDVKVYVETKKFKELYGLHQLMKKYEDAFEDNNDGTVTCQISGAKIAKKPGDIERYLKGKKFAQALEKVRKDMEAAKLAEEEKGKENGDEKDDTEMEDAEVPMLVASDDEEEAEPEPVKKPIKRKAATMKKTPSGRAKKKKISSK
uniref:Uncharacterized protein n=1 Tax=Panagrolaimus sp. ES5 TaxID=591445 RepID=A0AC34GTX4_9BILA